MRIVPEEALFVIAIKHTTHLLAVANSLKAIEIRSSTPITLH
jgi:hypothetical protein